MFWLFINFIFRLNKKLANFKEQYEIREHQFASQMKTKGDDTLFLLWFYWRALEELERQLLDAKLKQQLKIAEEEAKKTQAYKEQHNFFKKTEAELREQVRTTFRTESNNHTLWGPTPSYSLIARCWKLHFCPFLRPANFLLPTHSLLLLARVAHQHTHADIRTYTHLRALGHPMWKISVVVG